MLRVLSVKGYILHHAFKILLYQFFLYVKLINYFDCHAITYKNLLAAY
jgi:hypothetical protein